MKFVDECLLFDGDGGILYLSDIINFLAQYMIIKYNEDMGKDDNMNFMVKRNLGNLILENGKFKGIKRLYDRKKRAYFKNLKLNFAYM